MCYVPQSNMKGLLTPIESGSESEKDERNMKMINKGNNKTLKKCFAFTQSEWALNILSEHNQFFFQISFV